MYNKEQILELIEEFTSIDLVPMIKASKIKDSTTHTQITEAGKTESFLSSKVINDAQGRPLQLINYAADGSVIDSYQYTYEANFQKIELSEYGKKTCAWSYSYNTEGALIRSEYREFPDDSYEIETYTYDAKGRLTEVLMDVYPQEVEEEEPATGLELVWNEQNQLLSISEIYGDEEEARIDFQYNDLGQVDHVKKYLYLVDEDDEDVEEIVDEQRPQYNEEGKLIENKITYHSNQTALHIFYSYEADGLRTLHKEYESKKLVKSIEFKEDTEGNLLHSKEIFYDIASEKTDSYSYNFL